jgi:hypothetical protein
MAYLIQLILLASIFIVPTLSNGPEEQQYLLRCDDILKRTGIKELENVVKGAVEGAKGHWQNVGKEVDELDEYEKIRTNSNAKMADEPSGHDGLTSDQLLWNAKIVSLSIRRK